MDSSLLFPALTRRRSSPQLAAARRSSPQLATARLSIARLAARVYVRGAQVNRDSDCAPLGVLVHGRVCWLVFCWVVAKKWPFRFCGFISALSQFISALSRLYLSMETRLSPPHFTLTHGYLTAISRLSHGYLTAISRLSPAAPPPSLKKNGTLDLDRGCTTSAALPIEQSTPGFSNSRIRALPHVHLRSPGSRPSS